jgi:hypothetical protein
MPTDDNWVLFECDDAKDSMVHVAIRVGSIDAVVGTSDDKCKVHFRVGDAAKTATARMGVAEALLIIKTVETQEQWTPTEYPA